METSQPQSPVRLRSGPCDGFLAHEGFAGCERVVVPTTEPVPLSLRLGRSCYYAIYKRSADFDVRRLPIFDFEQLTV